MKVLIATMAAMAETAGPSSRTRMLVGKLNALGVETATCQAEDINYKKLSGVKNYYLTIPMPLGLPKFYASHVFPVVQKLGINRVKAVNSFDEVLHLTGNTDYGYLVKSVDDIRCAIRDFDPDIVYSEFNMSAIIAAKLEDRRLYISASYPTQHGFAHNAKYSVGLNRFLGECGLGRLDSCLQLFDLADKKLIPSCRELDPLQGDNVVFCGTFKDAPVLKETKRDKILVYMGNGTVSQKRMVREISAAFVADKYQVYIAGRSLKEETTGNIHVAPYFDFDALLPETVLYINHGGQNSVIDGLINGVPELIAAGKIFERRYNAESVVKAGAGLSLGEREFNAQVIRQKADQIINDRRFSENALRVGKELTGISFPSELFTQERI